MKICTLKNTNAKNTDLDQYFSDNSVEIDPLQTYDITGKQGWFIGSPAEFSLKSKIERIGKPLKDWDIKINYGIKTGLNEAFIINTATKDRLCQEDPKSAEIIKPILRGRDIKRYGYEWADLWVIGTFPALRLDIENYPAIKLFLLNFGKDKLEQSGNTLSDGSKSRKRTGNKWFETQDQISYYREFQKEKIVYPNMTSSPCFAFTPDDTFVNDKAFIITSEKVSLKFLTALLNSKIANFQIRKIASSLGAEGVEVRKSYLEQLPIPILDTPHKIQLASLIEALVEEILEIKSATTNGDTVVASTADLEARIDVLVYELYELTAEEIAVVES